MPIIPPEQIDSEYNLAECIEHFDTEYLLDIIRNKINNINYANTLTEPNLISSLEADFKVFIARVPDDEPNIKTIREELLRKIIELICNKFNLQFNNDDDSIDLGAAAFYLYDFLICNRVNYMINFFVTFIINNKNSLCENLSLEEYRKSKDMGMYSKKVYADPKYGLIATNMKSVLQHIVSIGVTLYNIFQMTYTEPNIVAFLDNIVTDRGDFCKDFYASVIMRPEIEPIINVGVRLALQKIVGNLTTQDLREFMSISTPGGIING